MFDGLFFIVSICSVEFFNSSLDLIVPPLRNFTSKTANKANRTIPGKAYIYELMGRPMILGDNPATHELFEEDGKHFFVEMSNPQALADKIAEVADKAKKTGE